VFPADRGYDSDHIRKTIARRAGAPIIAGTADRKVPIRIDAMTDALTNRVERCFNKLECSRRPATRYDKTAAGYPGFISNRSRAALGQESVNMTQACVKDVSRLCS